MKQRGGLRVEAVSDAHDGREANVPLSSLKPADLRRMQVTSRGKLLLGHPSLKTKRPDRGPEALLGLGVVNTGPAAPTSLHAMSVTADSQLLQSKLLLNIELKSGQRGDDQSSMSYDKRAHRRADDFDKQLLLLTRDPYERERIFESMREREQVREEHAAAARAARAQPMSIKGWLAAVAVVVLIVGVQTARHDSEPSSSATPASSEAPLSSVPAPEVADCSGTNGNAAVAACHPDDPVIQAACPDNSGGDMYAAPSDACLQAVRDS